MTSDLFLEVAEDSIKKDPILILIGLFFYAISDKQIDDDHYYLYLRLRNLITPKHLKTEKVRGIIINAFSSKCAYKFIKLLEEVELLEMVFPSIYALIKIDGGHYHNETVYTHVMGALRALDKLNLPWYVKFAALYHDCGKQKFEDFEDGRRRFTDHAPFGSRLVEGDLRRFNFDTGMIKTIKTLVCYHMTHINDQMDIHVKSLRKLKSVFDKIQVPLKYFFWIRYADNMGSAKKRTDFSYYFSIYRKCLKALNPPHIPSVKDLVINGYDIMKLFPGIQGKVIGVILGTLFKLWQSGLIQNQKNTLTKMAIEIKAEMEKA